MNYIQSKPYALFLGLILVLLSFGFYKGKETLDINIYDIYYIISWNFLMILISILFGLLALIYFALLKLNFGLINWMTVLHVLASIIGLFAIFTLPQLMKENFPIDSVSILDNARFNDRIRYGIAIFIMALVSAQILFFVNVIYSLVKGRS